MSRLVILALTIHMLVACGQTEVALTLTPERSSCAEWRGQGAEIVCYAVEENRHLFQSIAEQATLTRFGMSIVVDGTIIAVLEDDLLSIAVLEGRSVVGLDGRTQIISQGQTLEVTVSDNQAVTISDSRSMTPQFVENLPLTVLPREIDQATFLSEPTLTPSAHPTLADITDGCSAPQNWNRIYIVQAGDTLAQIANRFNVSVDDLIDANCIENAQRINIGQEIFVPATGAVNNDVVGNSLSFRADDYSIRAEDCTVLRWDFTNIAGAYINDNPVSDNSLRVCPGETTTYTLRIVGLDDSERLRDLTITVLE